MPNTVVANPVSSCANGSVRSVLTAVSFPAPRLEQACSDPQFIALLEGYRGSGGLARGSEVFALAQRGQPGQVQLLANWIVNAAVICFDWQAKMWLPLFQFNSFDMTPQPGLDQVLAALRPAYETWELAQWFVQANPRLAGQTPADTLQTDLAAVLLAARADPRVVRH
ncbi:MAG: hypothetical protein PHS32_22585 [Rhodoferax sp.]|uniref:hypothetical protein n=1 Tax=Rhodoferax sp. TaxID=50421 RepID=UPI00260AD72D|nr:hypothetical protein [Rhodoferax sp.]MDD5336535.1 hypothetical protein [Rhodoferax sp.]